MCWMWPTASSSRRWSPPLRLAFLGWMEDFHVPLRGGDPLRPDPPPVRPHQPGLGEALCCVVVNGSSLPHTQELVRRLRQAVPSLVGVVLNQNPGTPT